MVGHVARCRCWGTISSLPKRFRHTASQDLRGSSCSKPGLGSSSMCAGCSPSLGSHCAGTPCCIVVSLLYMYVCTVGTRAVSGCAFLWQQCTWGVGGKVGLLG